MRLPAAIAALVAAMAASVLVAVTIGPADFTVVEVWRIAFDHVGGPAAGVTVMRDHIVWDLRFPRVIGSAVVGAGLAVVGAVTQTLTRNPMADPYLLGISSGGSLGAVLVIVAGVGGGIYAISVGAFLGALGAFVLVLLVANRRGHIEPTRMVLSGIAIGQITLAVTSFVIIWVADPHATQEVSFWMSGSMSIVRWPITLLGAGVLVVVGGIALVFCRPLDALAFGEHAAASLGVDVDRMRWILLVACALLTGTIVAMSGTIGFVGLIVPHAARFVVGARHHRLLPISALVGAIFLVWVDTVARTLFDPREVPVGIITAIVGVPAFVALLRGQRRVAALVP